MTMPISPFTEIHDFIQHRMRMSHVYQPVMLATLLKSKGQAEASAIAQALLNEDPSQNEYYTQIVNNMVGRVLRNHGLVSKVPRKSAYKLNNFDNLSPKEIKILLSLCEEKLSSFNQSRGDAVWEHRRRNRRAVPGTVRYEVLQRAKNRCELCGISSDEKALEVDHIVPKNIGGIDDLSNYQALCYSCNSSKGDRDSTDLRGTLIDYTYREAGCLFCHAYKDREIIIENTLAYVISDGFPVTNGHALIIPKRHVKDYFGLSTAELSACNKLIFDMKKLLLAEDNLITGFNI